MHSDDVDPSGATAIGGEDRFEERAIREAATAPDFAARWTLGPRLGRGATGVVFRAQGPAGDVAIKFLHSSAVDEYRARFAREGRFLANLKHPGIVRVIDQGDLAGRPYLVLELLEGGSLHERMRRDGAFAPAEAARITLELLDALGACHQAGIVHRDVKPANLLFDGAGAAKLSDLGVSRTVAAGETMTSTGEPIGTPRYMSPEQVRGQKVGPAADQYAVGVLFYELLAGHAPFTARSAYDLMQMHVEFEAPSLTQVVPSLSPLLAALVDRLMAKDPDRRFPDVAAAAAALRALVDAGAVAGTKPLPASGAGAAPTLLRSGLRVRPRRSWSRALAAVAVVAVALGGAYAAGLLDGVLAEPERRPVRSLALGASAHDVAVSADGTRLVAHVRHDLVLVDTAAAAVIRTLATHVEVDDAAISGDGRVVASLHPDGRLRVFDTATGQEKPRIETGGKFDELALSPDGALVAACGDDANVRRWRTATGEALPGLPHGQRRCTALAFGAGGLLAHAGVQGPVVLRDAETGTVKRELRPDVDRTSRLAISADGRHIAATGWTDNRLIIWNIATGDELAAIKNRYLASIRRLELSPDGARAITADEKGRLRVWDAATRRRVATLASGGAAVKRIAIAPDGRTFLVVNGAGILETFEMP